MDFLDPRKRRSHTIRLFIGYALVGVALAIGTGIVALYAYGYDFNRQTKTIVQNGLVFVDARPEAADIYLNGQSKGQTGARLVLTEGHYSLELRRNGYRTWKKDFDLSGSELARLVYPLMIPEKLVTKDAELLTAAPGFASSSPDRRWLIMQKPNSHSEYQLFDLSSASTAATNLSLPTTLFTEAKGTHSVQLVEWSTDNRRLLVRHDYGSGVEYAIIDREAPTSSVNLTKFYGRPTVRFSLRDKKYDQYYLYEPTDLSLSTAELKAKTITPYLQGVLAFKSHGNDTVVYKTRKAGDATKDTLILRMGANTTTLREMAHNDSHLLDMAKFDGRWYITAASATEGRTYVFRDPHLQANRDNSKLPAPVAAMRLENPTALSFSTNSRFIAVQSGSSFAVYDNEDVRQLRFDTKLKPSPNTLATWMDGHRMTLASEGKLYMFDFDGNNMQALTAGLDAYPPYFDKDYKTMFNLGPSVTVNGRTALLRTDLRAAN